MPGEIMGLLTKSRLGLHARWTNVSGRQQGDGRAPTPRHEAWGKRRAIPLPARVRPCVAMGQEPWLPLQSVYMRKFKLISKKARGNLLGLSGFLFPFLSVATKKKLC